MRNKLIGLVSLLTPAVVGALAGGACSSTNNPLASNPLGDVCGPCGTLETGDVGISGNAKLDGFFSAVSTLNASVTQINADFETNIDSLIATFGVNVDANASLDAKVTALNAQIKADISANVMGGVTVAYQPPECQADVNVAVNAEASCEAKAKCDVQANPGQVSVQCQGSCEGSCSAGCMGDLKCDLSAGGSCTGSCEGTCQLDAKAACNGTCHGTCDGTCTATDAMGNCNGTCTGNCQGSCELSAAATCSGKCTGSCVVMAEADCKGSVTCSGQCMGSCTGSCTGTATPPSASAKCDATADCQAQASAQASAHFSCSPPTLKVDYTLKAGADASAQASFVAHITELRARGVAIVQGFAKYSALFDGKVNGKVVISPSPVAQIVTSVQGLASIDASASILSDIPAGKIPCVIPAFSDAGNELATMVTQSKDNLAAQAKFATAVTTGNFGS
jgi:modification target Cys-rich repeat protein